MFGIADNLVEVRYAIETMICANPIVDRFPHLLAVGRSVFATLIGQDRSADHSYPMGVGPHGNLLQRTD